MGHAGALIHSFAGHVTLIPGTVVRAVNEQGVVRNLWLASGIASLVLLLSGRARSDLDPGPVDT
ncbi:hypothetical protein ACPF8X_09870 [Streptomyces sp. G35A]